ncbi:uncharacterized [Tachysurus ichikawai]
MILAFKERFHKLYFFTGAIKNKEQWSSIGVSSPKHGRLAAGCIQESYTFSLHAATTRNTAKAMVLRFKFSLLGDEEQHYNPFQT